MSLSLRQLQADPLLQTLDSLMPPLLRDDAAPLAGGAPPLPPSPSLPAEAGRVAPAADGAATAPAASPWPSGLLEKARAPARAGVLGFRAQISQQQ